MRLIDLSTVVRSAKVEGTKRSHRIPAMTLVAGTSIAQYRVTELIGAGGMGEVYRATDAALDRDVAIKILPEAFAQDADRLARFEREAKTLAAFNHSHIAAVYGLEKWQGTCALVMELVDGLTLAERIAQGPIPLDEALAIALPLTEALEAAHERGIVHRDFKPANIKIRTDGTVKVLDFGLAKAFEPPAAATGSHSPTITTPAMTQAGVILGTAAYMSPEQARGTPVDKRADVWAFGVVFYEMLAGRRLFDEPSVSDTSAAVLKGTLTLDALPRDTPSSIVRLVGRCLTRDWRRRLRDIGEARIAIEDAMAHPDAAAASDAAEHGRPSRWLRLLPWAIAVAALVAAAVTMWAPWRTAPAPGPATRLTAEPGAQITLALGGNSETVLLSPNGRLLVLVGSPRSGDRSRLYLRPLDQLSAAPVPGTEGARNPFFSPDSRWIGFFADGKLKKIPVCGGAPVAVADAPDDRGGSWADNGWIAFSPRSGELPLYRVSADGGTAEPLTTLERGDITHRWPQVLPGGAAVLYTASKATGDYEEADIVVRSIGTGQTRIVHHGGYHARYLPTRHLIYVSQGTLFAVPFDVERFEITGQASPVLSGFVTTPGTAAAQVAFSQDGTLVYVPGANARDLSSLAWLGRDGSTKPLRGEPADYRPSFRFSPDGDRLALTIASQRPDIWIFEWGREVLSRLTSNQSLDVDPLWTPDGRRITFRSARDGVDNLYWQPADGDGEPQRLTVSKIPQFPTSWHPSGKVLAYYEFGQDTGADIWMLPVEGDERSGWKPGKATVFLARRGDESDAMFSPDGRWLAYRSEESGEDQVYVTAFPGPGARTRISTAGGKTPRWSRNGKELFFASTDQQIMVVTYTVEGDTFRAGKPVVWAKGTFASFDLHPDGRVAIMTPMESTSPATAGRLSFALNFFDEIRRTVPSSGR